MEPSYDLIGVLNEEVTTARSTLAQKVVATVEGERGGSLATEHNSTINQVVAALRDLFRREGVELL